VLYAETTQGKVFAVDGKTGAIKWTYNPGYGPSLRRGVAVGEGKVFTAMAGLRVMALDQNTGKVIWERQLSDETGIRSLKAAITYYDGMIYVGGGDGSRGVGLAMNASTGETVWKFYGPAGPGEFGNDTWEGDTWKTGGGSPWMSPAIDPELGLVYWTFGNARSGSAVDGSTRGGQNLFANSIVAMDAKTGKRVWHFQSIHHDIWDMDNVMTPVLIDLQIDGQLKKDVVYGSKTGMLYILDRATGEPLTPIDEKPVPQAPYQKSWPTQPYPRGDALVPLCPPTSGPGMAPPNYKTGCLFTPHTDEIIVTTPGTGGGNAWSPLSFSPRTGLVYVPIGIGDTARSLPDGGIGFRPLGQIRAGKIVAFNPVTHKIAWQKEMPWALAHGDGILTTQSDLMFIGQPDGLILGMDLKDGRELWKFQTGAGANTTPITYEVEGEQYIAILAGGTNLVYDSQQGDHLWAFKLGGQVAPAAAPPALSVRQPITAAAVEGSVVNNTVNIARNWTNGALGAAEATTQRSMAPQNLRVPVGTTVTFLNPLGNNTPHCATQFFEGLFNTGPLQPGQSFSYTFKQPGEYFYNDCTSPRTTGKVTVY
jgi:PQQ-dependent dehydrogenase (methanol/ethanol family)